MELTASFLRNITSFIGDFSGLLNDTSPDDKCYLNSCDLYTVEDFTDRTLSYVITFKDEEVYHLFENILFTNYSKSLFDDRGQNGLVYSINFGGDKLVLHLHLSNLKLHLQGKACTYWFNEHFSTLAKQLHTDFDSVSKSNNITIPVANRQEVSLLHDISDDIETYPKQVKHDDFPSFSDRFLTSTPIGKDDINVTDVTATTDPVVISLQQEIKNLKEIIVSLQDKVNKICDPVHQQTQTFDQYVDSSSQTDDIKYVSRHTETSNMSVKSISTQIYKTIESKSVSSQTEKGIPPTISDGNVNSIETQFQYEGEIHDTKISQQSIYKSGTDIRTSATKTLIIGSSLLKGIKTRGLKNTDIRTNRGAKIPDIIDAVEKMDLSPYKTIIVHIGGNDVSAGVSMSHIKNAYESLLYTIRSNSKSDSVLVISGIPPRYDVDVYPINSMLKEMCDNFNLIFIDHIRTFCDYYGNVKGYLFHSDGIHLSKNGTSLFLNNINVFCEILKHRPSNYCKYCGENGHNAESCRHGKSLKCFNCGNHGHKEKFCNLYFQ